MPFTQEQLEELRARSVKEDDVYTAPGVAGAKATVLQILVPTASPSTILPPVLPAGLKERDRVLAMTPRVDAQWGAANGIAITKIAALAWEAKGSVELRSKRAQELLLHADSVNGPGGWVTFISKQLRDFLCTNNGCHFEIIRQKAAYGSRVVGIAHLSSLRCYRTGDPEYPIVYRDRLGREHLLRWWEVVSMADLPDPDEMLFGAGLCAAERAYSQIIKLAAIERFVYEKVSATRPLAIHIVNGLQTDELNDALQSAHLQREQKGLSTYMGAVIMSTLKPDSPPAVVTIPLAELPNGFNAIEERDRADLLYANAIGLDPQELKPISNQQLGAGGQSQILHQKAKGRGLVAYRQNLVHNLNEMVLDAKTKFLFTEHDYDDQKQAADISSARANVAMLRIGAQITSPEEERQLMVDQDELPKTFLEYDETSTETTSDTDKPEADENEQVGMGIGQELDENDYVTTLTAKTMQKLRGSNTIALKSFCGPPANPFRPWTVVRAPDITFKHGRHDQSTHGRKRGSRSGGGTAGEAGGGENPKLVAARAKLAKLKEDLAIARKNGDTDTVRRLENGRGSLYSRVKKLEQAEKGTTTVTPPKTTTTVAPKPAPVPVKIEPPAPPVAAGAKVSGPKAEKAARVHAANLKALDSTRKQIEEAKADLDKPGQDAKTKAYNKSRLQSLKNTERALQTSIDNYNMYGSQSSPKTDPFKPKKRTDVPTADEALAKMKAAGAAVADVENHPKLVAAKQKMAEIAAKDPKGKTTAYHMAMSEVAVTRHGLIAEAKANTGANAVTFDSLLANRTPAAIKRGIRGDPPPTVKAQINKELDWVNKVVGQGTSLDGKTVFVEYHNEPGRAHAKQGVLHIYSNTKEGVVAHEAMHWVEYKSSDVLKRSQQYLDDRTKGEKPKTLKSLNPYSNYPPHEIAKPDKFRDAYVGRIYDFPATEITSMGIQYMFQGASHFANADPDHFRHVWESVIEAQY